MIGIVLFLFWALFLKSGLFNEDYASGKLEDEGDMNTLNAMVTLCAEAIRSEDFKQGSILNKEQQATLAYQLANALKVMDDPREHLRKCIENDY